MPALSRVFSLRLSAACLLLIAGFGTQTVLAQMPSADHGAVNFSPGKMDTQTVRLAPSPVANFMVRVVPPGSANFHIQTDNAACTQADLAVARCLLSAKGNPVSLTISFTPAGAPVAALIDTRMAGASPDVPWTPLVALSGSGPRPVPTADHAALDFNATSAAQTVKIKPASGESYGLKLTGAGANSFHIKTDTATCTEGALVAGDCSMKDTDGPVTLTITFTPTGNDVAAEIDAIDIGGTTPVVALSGSGNKQPPDVDRGAIVFNGSDRQTVKITPAANPYVLKLSGATDYRITSDIGACTDAQLTTADGCPLPAAGKNVKPVTLTINPKHGVKAPAIASIVATYAGIATPIVTLAVQQSADGELDCAAQYSDCDLTAGVGFSLLGGVEQSYLSSEQDQTYGFIRAYAQVMNGLGPSTHWTVGPWGVVRDLGTPQSGANQNIVSAVSNPTGGITTSSLSSIGYSIDFLVGLAGDHPGLGRNGRFSWGPIIAAGATTPLSSATASAAYAVPTLGTQECSQVQMRFASTQAYGMGYSTQLVPGGAGTAVPGACLINSNVNGSGSPTQVNTLAFSGENRSNFLEKWEAGVRTTYRIYTNKDQQTCDSSNPCQRGIVDYTLGEDAAITRGAISGLVAKVDGVQPLPFAGGYFYLFGSVALRFKKDIEYSPLILQAATLGTTSIPNTAVFVEPLMQPNKDFYRIGVGVSLDKIFTAMKGK